MALGTNPRFSQIRSFFGGSANFKDYYRGGPYVPNIPANNAISTTSAGLRMSQFSGADNASAPTITAASGSASSYASGRSASGSAGASIQLYPGGGNGSYSLSTALVSQSGTTNANPTVNGTVGSMSCTVSGVSAGTSKTATTVGRYYNSSNGQTVFIDLTFYLTWENTTQASCVTTLAHVSPMRTLLAGDTSLYDELFTTDPYSDEPEVVMAQVRKSETNILPCVRLTMANGTWLECSTTAPIPVSGGHYMDADKILGMFVPTASAEDLVDSTKPPIDWSQVVSVEPIGHREVQLIYVDDRAFWASGDGKRFVLHHNSKQIV